MPHSAPTLTEFRARHPRFASVGDTIVTSVLVEMARVASQAWAADDYRDAVLHLTAHTLTVEGAGETGAPTVTAGPIAKLEAGDVEVEYVARARTVAGVSGLYEATPYGVAYLQIRARYAGGMWAV